MSVDDTGLRMRRISQRLAEQACGRPGIAPPREHEVDRGAGGIEGSVEVAPAPLDTNVGLIDTPGRVGWLEMTAQPILQFGTVALDPAPDGCVVRLKAALAEQRRRRPQLQHNPRDSEPVRSLLPASRSTSWMVRADDRLRHRVPRGVREFMYDQANEVPAMVAGVK